MGGEPVNWIINKAICVIDRHVGCAGCLLVAAVLAIKVGAIVLVVYLCGLALRAAGVL